MRNAGRSHFLSALLQLQFFIAVLYQHDDASNIWFAAEQVHIDFRQNVCWLYEHIIPFGESLTVDLYYTVRVDVRYGAQLVCMRLI